MRLLRYWLDLTWTSLDDRGNIPFALVVPKGRRHAALFRPRCYTAKSASAATAADPVVRIETAPGEQLQVGWGEFRQGRDPLAAFAATLGQSRSAATAVVSRTDLQHPLFVYDYLSIDP